MWPYWMFWIVNTICKGFFKVYNRTSCYGKEHFPPDSVQPVIVASNHVSALDPIMLSITFPRRLRPIAKEELFTGNKLFAWFITKLGAFPLNRETENNASAALKKFIDILRQGQDMMIFPEGGRSYDGRLQRIEGGAALVAARENTPIVPAYIQGAFEAMPIGSSWCKPHKINVVYGPIIYPDPQLSAKENRQYIQAELEKRLSELQDRCDRGDYES